MTMEAIQSKTVRTTVKMKTPMKYVSTNTNLLLQSREQG